MPTIGVRTTDELDEKLAKAAKDADMSKSAFAAKLIEDGLSGKAAVPAGEDAELNPGILKALRKVSSVCNLYGVDTQKVLLTAIRKRIV